MRIFYLLTISSNTVIIYLVVLNPSCHKGGLDMTDTSKFDIDDFIKRDTQDKRARQQTKQGPITVREYLGLVKENPEICQNAHSRILDILRLNGVVEFSPQDQIFGVNVSYRLITEELFGHAPAKAAEEFATWLDTGARGIKPTGAMAIALVGPTASGKSTFVNILTKALEKRKTPVVYKISGCPMQEEPLHALPRYIRRVDFDLDKARSMGLTRPIEDELGIGDIEGDLCPHCRRSLMGWEDVSGNFHPGKNNVDGIFDWSSVQVETFTFSRQAGVGIGSFEPSDEKTQDVTDLVGKENIAVTKNPSRGLGDPDAFALNGELEKGNRGIVEAREIFKVGMDERILWVFINVADTKEIKVQGSNLPHISVDTVTIGHCNLRGFEEFANERGQEALHSRFYIIKFPYNLRVRDQVRVYEKLVQKEKAFVGLKQGNGHHIAPGALELAASFEVLTHLSESKIGVDLLTKLRAYNGESVLVDLEDDERHPIDLESLIEEGQSNDDIAKREGMFGLDVRNVLSALSVAVVNEPNGGCLTPLKAIRALRNIPEHVVGHDTEDMNRYLSLLDAEEGGSIITLYEEWIVKQVGRAFLGAYEDLAKEIFNKYLEEVEHDRQRKRRMVRGDTRKILRDEVTGKPKEPDETFMRSVEAHLGVTKDQADVFRGEILEYRATHPDFNYDTYEPLREAVEKKILADARTSLTLVLAKDTPKGEEEKNRARDLFDGLKDMGFCEICARETVVRAAEILNK